MGFAEDEGYADESILVIDQFISQLEKLAELFELQIGK